MRNSFSYTENKLKVNYINTNLSNFSFKDIADEVDTIITDIPEPWEFFMKNKINWGTHFHPMLQIQKRIIRQNDYDNSL